MFLSHWSNQLTVPQKNKILTHFICCVDKKMGAGELACQVSFVSFEFAPVGGRRRGEPTFSVLFFSCILPKSTAAKLGKRVTLAPSFLGINIKEFKKGNAL